MGMNSNPLAATMYNNYIPCYTGQVYVLCYIDNSKARDSFGSCRLFYADVTPAGPGVQVSVHGRGGRLYTVSADVLQCTAHALRADEY